MGRKNKFYSVAREHQTGIFKSWEQCQKQTRGFKTADYKSFHTEQEAEEWLNIYVKCLCSAYSLWNLVKLLRREENYILLPFVLHSHYGDSSKKLNGHQAFESMSLN